VSGEGDAGLNSGPPGDLYVVLYIKAHKFFKRDGVNIYLEKGISFSQAAIGDTIEVETVEGNKELKIYAGIQSGTILSIKGAGVPYLNAPSRRGDQFIKINVVTPTHLSDEEKKLFERLAEIHNENLKKDGHLFDKIKGAFSGT
jgi:molecular chaperone DnaJ